MMRVLVTGGSGNVGHFVIDELYRCGHSVVNADVVRLGGMGHSGTASGARAEAFAQTRKTWPATPLFLEVDVTNYGQVISAMGDCDAVIALAARPSNSNYTEEDVFVTNAASMWNVCRAAEQLQIRPVVLGSSYNAIGAMGTAARWAKNEVKPPEYFPLDEHSYTRSEDAYSMSKWIGEEVGKGFARRSPWMSIASMRFNGMWDDAKLRQLSADPITDVWERCQGFWTYLHIKDAARACVMSIESQSWTGHHRFFLNAADTMIDVPTMDAIAEVYPDVPVKEPFEGFAAPISIANVQQVIGWSPQLSWRDEQFQESR
jgi:nucleoside-diphosphate-sugar epimerase